MKKLASALAAMTLAGSAMAVTTVDLGAGPGTFNLTGGEDTTFEIDLGAGQYTASLLLDTDISTFAKVWVSNGSDFVFGDPGDIAAFLRLGGTRARGTLDRTVTSPQTFYIHVDWNEPLLAGSSTGAFSGTLNITSAVPEPATGAMLLAGMGALGLVARRRRTPR
jgi:PEP-CTERM motif